MRLFSLAQENLTSDEYLKPSWVFEQMGVMFDMDVASSPAGSHVPARLHLYMADDGLSKPWEGLVWMNPPYSNASPWVRKFIEHGNGVALLPWAKSASTIELWQSDATIVLPPKWFDFDGGSIFIAVMFAGMGEGVVAVKRLGHHR